METIIFKITEEKNTFSDIYSDNLNIQCLGALLYDLRLEDIDLIVESFKKREIDCYTVNYINAFLYDENINIYIDYDDLPEIPDFRTITRFQIHVDRFIEILEKWKKMYTKKRTFIILKISENEIIFEEDYREEIMLDRSKTMFTEKSIENIFDLQIKDGLFNGGFHLMDNNTKNLRISNKCKSNNNAISVDINNDKDFTFNHAMFPEYYNIEYILQSVSYKSKGFLSAIKHRNDKSENIFCDWTTAKNEFEKTATVMRIIYNEKGEVISYYPIFEEEA